MPLRVSIEGTNQVVEIDGPVLDAFREIGLGNLERALDQVAVAREAMAKDKTVDAGALFASLTAARELAQALLYIPPKPVEPDPADSPPPDGIRER